MERFTWGPDDLLIQIATHFIKFKRTENGIFIRWLMTVPCRRPYTTRIKKRRLQETVSDDILLRIFYTALYSTQWISKSPYMLLPFIAIDVKMVVFWYPQMARKFLSPDSVSSNKTWVIIPGINSWKKCVCSNELDASKPLMVVSISQRSEKLRLNNLG